MELLSHHITKDTKITTGVGNHQMLAAQYLTTPSPKSFLTPGGFGPMGFALPAAIGAYHANPNSTILAIDGDGMVRNLQDFLYKGKHVATQKETEVNFSKIAQELGFLFHARVQDRDQLQPGLEKLMAASRPSFLEVVCDNNEILYPRIPAGQGYKDMVLGPYMDRD